MDRRSFLLSGSLLAVGAAAPAWADARAASFTVDAHIALQAYQALVEEHLTGALRAIRALAATADAQSANWTNIKPALDHLSRDLSTDATVWFALPDGSYAGTESGPVKASLADRDYFPALMAGRDIEGKLVISKSTGHRSIIVATPVMKGGRVVAAIGVSLRARLISQLVTERTNLPDDLTFYALDEKGQAAIHKAPDKMFLYPSDLGEPSLKAAVATILSQPQGGVDYSFEGSPRTAVFNKSDVTGWHFVLVQVHK